MQLAQEQLVHQKQYFENLAYQNSHIQLELKKLQELVFSQNKRAAIADDRFYVDDQKI